jgi:hypothetical protein
MKFSSHIELLSNTCTLKEGYNLPHLEDIVFNEPETGIETSVSMLNDIVDELSSKTPTAKMSITTKWDGAPAIVAGYDPSNKKYFVALKGVFDSKNPKLSYSEADIKTHYDKPELIAKLIACFKNLKSVIPTSGVYKGDLLFDKSIRKSESIDGVAHWTFRPNTITYAVPQDSPMGMQVGAADIGIVFHTKYSGSDISSMSESPLTNLSGFKKSTKVWFTDAKLPKPPTGAFVPSSEAAEIKAIVKQIDSMKRTATTIAKLMSKQSWWEEIKITVNSAIRAGVSSVNSSMLKNHLTVKLTKAIDALKTDAGKKKKQNELDKAVEFIDAYAQQIDMLFKVHGLIAQAKLVVVNRLSVDARGIGTYVPTNDGLKPTSPEGFVAVCGSTCRVIKLVNRLEFSRMNFNLPKDWKK